MDKYGRGIATVGICGAVAVGLFVTKSADCLWALFFLIFVW